MKVIFLDIDGVLNDTTTNSISKKLAEFLNKITTGTRAKIVISSSWRNLYSLDELRLLLDEGGVTGDVIGKTDSLDIWDYQPAPRGCEIQKFIVDKDVKQYAIIDDENDMLLSQKDNFFQTESKVGLTADIAYKIINHLK